MTETQWNFFREEITKTGEANFTKMHEKGRGRGLATAFTAGALSATCSTLMFQPLDLVKTRMQMRALAAPLCL